MSELSLLLNVSASSAESVEHLLEVSSLLHGDNSQLIFFVHPDEESLFIIVINSSAFGPVPVQATSFQESVSFPRRIKKG